MFNVHLLEERERHTHKEIHTLIITSIHGRVAVIAPATHGMHGIISRAGEEKYKIRTTSRWIVGESKDSSENSQAKEKSRHDP